MRKSAVLAFAFGAMVAFAPAAHAIFGILDRVLTGGVELCDDGARFTVRAGDETYGSTDYGQVFLDDGTTLVASEPFTFTAFGDKRRIDLHFPTTYSPGTTLILSVSDTYGDATGTWGTTLSAQVGSCHLVMNGEADSFAGWTAAGTVGILDDSQFDYDGDGTSTDALGLGHFFLLSTKRATSQDVGDVDGNGEDDYDPAYIGQAIHPKYPCDLHFFFAFYSSEVPTIGYDDFFVFADSYGAAGGSVPGVSGSTYSDWYAFDGVSRTVTGTTGDLEGSFFFRGGSLGYYASASVPADTDFDFAFGVFDQFDGNEDSGILLDRVECISRYLFNANFEDGSLDEWDGVTGIVD